MAINRSTPTSSKKWLTIAAPSRNCWRNATLFMPSDYSPTDLAHARTIPSRWYLDPEMLIAESAKVFGRTWQPVGLASHVAEAGSYFACDIAGEPVVVTRD